MKKIFLILLILFIFNDLALASFRKSKGFASKKPDIGSIINWGDPLNVNLVGAWLINEGAGTKINDLMGRNQGSFIGGISWGTGRFGKSVALDGAAGTYINFTSLTLSGNQASVSMWIKPTNFTTYGDLLKNTSNNGQAQFYTYLTITTGAISISFANTTFTTSITPTTGVWSHLVFTYNAGTITLYVNGVQKAQSSGVNNSFSFVGFHIGAQTSGGTENYNGSVDNVLIFNRCLSNSEAMRLYSDPFAGIVSSNRRVITQGVSTVPNGGLFVQGNMFVQGGFLVNTN